jgi:phenylalanyl-tRNA synthetase beta chain
MQFLEVKNYHLLTKEDACEKMLHEHEVIPLLNAVGEHNHLRNSLLPSILKNLHENQHNEYPQNLFEVGRTFISGETETGVVEEEKLSIHLCHEKADFTEIKQVVDALCVSLGLPVEVQEMEHPSFITGRVGKLIISGKEVGVLGEFSPAVLEQWEITTPTVGCEIDIEKMFAILKK